MIAGTLNGRLEAVIPLTVFGPNGDSEVVQAIVDSGFTGRLVLPAAVVTKLGLVRQTGTVMRLATACPGASIATRPRSSGAEPAGRSSLRPSATRP
jgi:predicted aspartyl protease